jgi:hypothetical protein
MCTLILGRIKKIIYYFFEYEIYLMCTIFICSIVSIIYPYYVLVYLVSLEYTVGYFDRTLSIPTFKFYNVIYLFISFISNLTLKNYRKKLLFSVKLNLKLGFLSLFLSLFLPNSYVFLIVSLVYLGYIGKNFPWIFLLPTTDGKIPISDKMKLKEYLFMFLINLVLIIAFWKGISLLVISPLFIHYYNLILFTHGSDLIDDFLNDFYLNIVNDNGEGSGGNKFNDDNGGMGKKPNPNNNDSPTYPDDNTFKGKKRKGSDISDSGSDSDSEDEPGSSKKQKIATSKKWKGKGKAIESNSPLSSGMAESSGFAESSVIDIKGKGKAIDVKGKGKATGLNSPLWPGMSEFLGFTKSSGFAESSGMAESSGFAESSRMAESSGFAESSVIDIKGKGKAIDVKGKGKATESNSPLLPGMEKSSGFAESSQIAEFKAKEKRFASYLKKAEISSKRIKIESLLCENTTESDKPENLVPNEPRFTLTSLIGPLTRGIPYMLNYAHQSNIPEHWIPDFLTHNYTREAPDYITSQSEANDLGMLINEQIGRLTLLIEEYHRLDDALRHIVRRFIPTPLPDPDDSPIHYQETDSGCGSSPPAAQLAPVPGPAAVPATIPAPSSHSAAGPAPASPSGSDSSSSSFSLVSWDEAQERYAQLAYEKCLEIREIERNIMRFIPTYSPFQAVEGLTYNEFIEWKYPAEYKVSK